MALRAYAAMASNAANGAVRDLGRLDAAHAAETVG